MQSQVYLIKEVKGMFLSDNFCTYYCITSILGDPGADSGAEDEVKMGGEKNRRARCITSNAASVFTDNMQLHVIIYTPIYTFYRNLKLICNIQNNYRLSVKYYVHTSIPRVVTKLSRFVLLLYTKQLL